MIPGWQKTSNFRNVLEATQLSILRKIIAVICAAVRGRNRRITIRELSEVQSSYDSGQFIITEDLSIRRVPAKSMPKLLSATQRNT